MSRRVSYILQIYGNCYGFLFYFIFIFMSWSSVKV